MLEGRLTSHRKRVGAFLGAAALGASVVAAVLATAAPSALAAPGDLDTTFSGDGKVRTNFTTVAPASDGATGVAIQADGKIVAAGYASDGYTDARFALARYNRNGTLDTTFGGDGKVRTDFTIYSDGASAVAIQTDGKIVAAGYAGRGEGYSEFALARYNPDGTLDTTFGGDGKVMTDVTASWDYAKGVAIQADGKIVAAGSGYGNEGEEFALARYNPDGSLDASFGGDGKVLTNFTAGGDYYSAAANAVAIQADGKIVAAGTANGPDPARQKFALARYNPDGSLDATFSADGRVRTNFTTGYDLAEGVAIQADGKIVAAGTASFGYPTDARFALARYNPDGTRDTTFGGDGKVRTDFSIYDDLARAVAIQADGKIVAAGTARLKEDESGADEKFALARYNPNGRLDTTFSGDGKVRTNFTTEHGWDYLHGVAIQANGKIVAAGNTGGWGRKRGRFALARYLSG